MNRFFINELADSRNTIIDLEDIKHISKVLRLDIGDEIEIVDEKNKEYIMKIVEIEKSVIHLENIKKIDIQREDDVKIVLYQGIPKGSKMDDICKQITQVGIYEIVPVKFKRCVATDINKNKIERLQKIIDEASKQSKRTVIPEIKQVLTFKQMVQELSKNDKNIVFYEDERQKSIREFVKGIENIKKIGIIIGPEGGISEEEIQQLKEVEVDILTLGNRILRTETASIVAKSILTYELENKGE